jgi:hypothetical protein
MAYNIFAETDKKINWEELHQKIMPQKMVEYVPMPGMGVNGGDAMGLSIPSKNSGKNAWKELKSLIYVLEIQFQFTLYDMYYGARLDSVVLNKIKENLTT